MVKVYSARTLSVNPPGAEFLLKRDLLWKALQRKIRYPTEFVPAMQRCNMISDENGVVVRDCVLATPDGALRNMREEVTSYGDQWIIFRQNEGSTTMNIVSHGSGMADDDLQLTYIFEWEFPDVEPLTTAYTNAQHALDEIALMAVQKSISTARELVSNKTIQ